MRHTAATLLFTLALAMPAEAQEVTASIWAYGPLGVDELDGPLPVSLELRLTVPTSDRFALEPFVTAGWRHTRRGTSPEGFVGMQIRQRIVRLTSQNGYAFATYGAAVYHYDFRLLPDGIERWGQYPALFGQVGAGLHWRVSDHVVFRPEARVVTFGVVPIGVCFVVGLSLTLF
jgi:hypothetical protein